MRKHLLILFFCSLTFASFTQVVPEPVSNSPVYDLLDELASMKIISINSVIKPYSRKYIASKLSEALNSDPLLKGKVSSRIREEILFYLHDYGFDDFQKSGDTLKKKTRIVTDIDPPGCSVIAEHGRITLRPAIGVRYLVNENGNVSEFSGGGDLFGYVGKLIGFYAGVKQTWQSEALVNPEYFSLEKGMEWEEQKTTGVVNTLWRGGLSLAWRWGDLGLYNDRPVWGNSAHGSNILSGNAPSFPFIRLHLNPAHWIEFQYIHGWLSSNVVDSSRSTFPGPEGGDVHLVYRRKYIAANMLTVTPWHGLNISIGNSIIYSDVNPNPWYLIPILFYNSVDAEKNLYNNDNGSNSQLFFDVCSRQLRHIKIYATLFIDELKVSRLTDPGRYNFTSWKIGASLSDLPLRNIIFTAEWTKTNPLTYKHYIPTTDFATDKYCLGHYLRDNSQEVFLSLNYKPLKNLSLLLSWTWAEHGADYTYSGDAGEEITTLPVLTNLTWKLNEIRFSARYEILNRVSVFLDYANAAREGDVGYNPPFLHGMTNTLIAGISLGWE